MRDAARTYRQQLTNHIDFVRAEHDGTYDKLMQLRSALEEHLESHQQLFKTHKDAQDNVNAAQIELNGLREKQELFMAEPYSTIVDRDQNSTGMLAALAQDHRTQMLTHLKAHREARSKLAAAISALEEAEKAAAPVILYAEKERSQIEELSEALGKIANWVKHADLLLSLVKAGPSAIATLEGVLQTNGISLKDVADKIQWEKRSKEYERRLSTK